ncbi:hypothetical protein QJS10_CPB11g01522 [Acorus calamus]|uniref:Enoyl reductase (ER) domain-containing protein n=1 Tax=Acorus calamus TaxID=4465 RepID=A0AAV9DW19_ACOCL|nr:hypothetical protein QJS10_CPB11g01522 [Acorus calamus]
MADKLMRAVLYDSYGGGAAALKHVDVPIPSPKKDEVLLKLEASSINPVDWKIQKGMLRPFLPRKFPFIPVSDVAGEVVGVGSGVKNFKEGDKVVAMLNVLSGGGFAEYATASESLTVKRPSEVPPPDGAGLPVAGLTALQMLTRAVGIKFDGSGKRANVLVTAASGGVGHYAVQLAKLGDLHVTATCGARNIELVKSLGADEVVDYKTTEAGTFLNFVCKKLMWSKKQLVPLVLSPKAENLDFLVQLVKDGKLKTVVDSKYPLSKAEDAWAKIMDGHATGKVIVEMC